MEEVGRAKGVNGQKAKGKTEKKIRAFALVALSFLPFPLFTFSRSFDSPFHHFLHHYLYLYLPQSF
jgi:hypothetical protein